MHIVADLHIHSHYSRATSEQLNFEHLWKWAQLKGVGLLATGDIAHPGWLDEMWAKLEPAGGDLFRLRDEVAHTMMPEVPAACRRDVRFLLGGEISNIYKRHGQVRKVHNLVFAPTLEIVARIQAKLETIGNIRADGRPILGLDSRDLLEIVLEIDPRCHLIPAHIWTPWFSMLGSKSGFDTVGECFGDLTAHIFALETGLSSDPPMNWRVSMLDRYTLVSNSDAHSPQKLAREATLFEVEPSYDALFAAMRTGDPATFKGTIEFFPAEGKYHHDGHRKCGVSWEPRTTLAHDGRCSVCGRPVTVGVSHRVETLADRRTAPPEARAPYHSLIPLPEVVSELLGVGVKSKKVQQEYVRLLAAMGPELEILLDRPVDEIARAGGEQLAQGIARMRRGEVLAEPGYDGEYGVIKLFASVDADEPAPQLTLLAGDDPVTAHRRAAAPASPPAAPPVSQPQIGVAPSPPPVLQSRLAPPRNQADTWQQVDLFSADNAGASATGRQILATLNDEQRAAVRCVSAPVIIVAGPGTGKTRTLTHRIAYLIEEHGVNPSTILAITFTNRAAGELTARLVELLGEARAAQATIKTFHAFGLQLLATYGQRIGIPPHFAVVDEAEQLLLLTQAVPELARRDARRALDAIAQAKNQLQVPAVDAEPRVGGWTLGQLYTKYTRALAAGDLLDFEDLIGRTVELFQCCPDVLQAVQGRYRWISVDEYQDVNLAQVQLLRLLTVGGANLCVIGDPDQAIYGFRGADRNHFLAFPQEVPDAQLLRLSHNYRSAQTILAAAQQVIDKNPDRDARRVWSDFVSATKVTVHPTPTDRAEAETIVHQIEQLVGGTSYFSLDSNRVDDRTELEQPYAFGDFAVLYRTRAQCGLLVEAFARSGIPYQCAGQQPLTAYPDVQRILAHLWLQHNPASALHWSMLFNADRTRLAPDVAAEFCAGLARGRTAQDALAEQLALVPGPQQAYVTAVAARHDQLAAHEARAVVDLIQQLVAAMQADDEHGASIDAERAAWLVRRAHLHGPQLGDFLAACALEKEADQLDPRADRVALLTLHASKGLEFPVVFMVGCEEGLLPFRRGEEEPDVEEERRLFYVGMTRARQRLTLSYARSRVLFGQRQEHPVSRFVTDVEASLVELQRMAARRRPEPAAPDHQQLSLFG